MPTQYIKRDDTPGPGAGVGKATAAPIYVDSDDNILKIIPGGAASTTEVQVVDASSAQTLTNKTLTSPTITGATLTTATLTSPTINGAVGTTANEVVAATNVITVAESGKTFFLNAAAEFVSTLPAPAAGLNYTFIVTAAPASASYTVVTEGGCQILAGHVLAVDLAGTDSGTDVEGAATGTTITFVDSVSVVGDKAYVISDGTSWFASCLAGHPSGITITD